MKIPPRISLALLVIVTVLGLVYLSLSVIQFDPRKSYNTVSVELPTSGGLMDTSQVLLRGLQVGKVTSIRVTKTGLEAELKLDASYDIPLDSAVQIANLSAAGEQYVNFRPKDKNGPYITDGTRIPASQVETTVTVSEMLQKMDAITSQINPQDLLSITTTMNQAFDGTDAATDNLLLTNQLVAHTLDDKNAELTRLYINLQTLSQNLDGYGQVLVNAATELATATPEVVRFISSLPPLAQLVPGGPGKQVAEILTPLLDKVGGYVDVLAPDLAFIATVLKPVTSAISPYLNVNLEASLKNLLQVFPEGGPARIAVTIPK